MNTLIGLVSREHSHHWSQLCCPDAEPSEFSFSTQGRINEYVGVKFEDSEFYVWSADKILRNSCRQLHAASSRGQAQASSELRHFQLERLIYRRYLAVRERPSLARVAGVPRSSSSPPLSPRSGPRSITQSAALMTSRLCSTTITVTATDQHIESLQQFLHVIEMQSSGRLVKQEKNLLPAIGLLLAALGQEPGQLDSLALSSGKGGGTLTQFDVGKSHIHKRLQLMGNLS